MTGVSIAEVAKALTGAVIAGLTALLTAVESGGISAAEGITVAIAFFVALGAVYTVPNTSSGSAGRHPPDREEPPP